MFIKYLLKCVPTEFHASSEAIIRQLPEKRLQSEIYQNLKTLHTGCGAQCVQRDATVNWVVTFFSKNFLECLQHDVSIYINLLCTSCCFLQKDNVKKPNQFNVLRRTLVHEVFSRQASAIKTSFIPGQAALLELLERLKYSRRDHYY